MKLTTFSSLCLLGVILVGCNNSSTTSTSGSGEGLTFNTATSMESSSGSQINMIYKEPIVAGQKTTFYFQLRPEGATPGVTTGTVHWGDNRAARIRDDHNIPVVKTWADSGSYDIAVQIDGEEKVAVMRGLAVGNSAMSSAVAEVFSNATGRFVGHVCTPAAGTPVTTMTDVSLTLPAPTWSDGTADPIWTEFSEGCPRRPNSSTNRDPGFTMTSNPPDARCAAGAVFEIHFQSDPIGVDTAFCRWPVQ